MREYLYLIIYAVSLFFGVFGGSFLVRYVLKPFKGAAEELGGLDEAGEWIGRFERAIVILLVFVEAYNAIGLIIAAKSIARFRKLSERQTAEYYLVGTLASTSFAIAVGVITNFAVQFIK